ncbi:MAG: hypothetical protein JNM72_02385 [Deltaproteobacteria bacterium]|nr:hypothetical protein [Deltaproteobacteria bacterium]
MIAVWDADLKLTDSDPDNATIGCNVFNADGSTRDRWPFAPLYDSTASVYTHADPNAWALNDPTRTIELMQINGINLYLHDARAGLAIGYLENAYFRCDWVALAGLNDHITAIEGPDSNTFTGMVLGRVEPEQVLSTGYGAYVAADVDLCYYRDWVGRARAEAFEHPHHKFVLVDELTHMLASPFRVFNGQSNPWDRSDIEVLRGLATELDAAAVGSHRASCDAIWDPIIGDDAVDLGWVPSPEADQNPVELWAKVNAATVPMFLVPSMMLGAPSGLVHTGAMPLVSGNRYLTRWVAPPAPTTTGDLQQVKLQYLITTLNNGGDRLRVEAAVNGAAMPASRLYTKPTVGNEGKALERENIHLVEVIVWPPSSSGPPPLWDIDAAGENTVEVYLEAEANSLRYEPEEGPWYYDDRVVLVWGVQVVYEGADGVPIEVHELQPDEATTAFRPIEGEGEVPCDGFWNLCETNEDLRIDDLLDGVTIAQEISATWPDPSTYDHPPLEVAWDRFMQHACGHLHEFGSAGAGARCLVDERAWVSDAARYLDYLDVGESISRLGSGIDKGDGASVTFLTLEIEDILEGRGRFSVRDPADPGYPYVAHLPMLTRNMLGEGVLWEVDTQSNPACEGDWLVEWRLPGCPARWTYGPVGELWDPMLLRFANTIDSLDDLSYYELFALNLDASCAPGSASLTGSFTIELGPTNNGLFRFGWEIKDDTVYPTPDDVDYRRIDVGDSGFTPQFVEMRLTSPDPATCAISGVGSEVTVTQAGTVDGDLYTYYEVLTCVMQQGGEVTGCY